MQIVHRIDGRTIWANMLLLFCLSLTPIATAWLGDAGVESGPVAAYAIVLLACGIAYTFLTLALLSLHEADSKLAKAIGSDLKGRVSIAAYALGLAFAWVEPWVSVALFIAVEILWFVPDRRVVRALQGDG
jgi:uncharacterized membrane protein